MCKMETIEKFSNIFLKFYNMLEADKWIILIKRSNIAKSEHENLYIDLIL